MKSINFDEGYKTYAVNGDESRVIKIRISDFNLLKRVESAMTEIESLKNKYNGKLSENTMIEFDSSVRKIIDKAFDSDICANAFGSANICTVVNGGKLLFESFFEAFIPLLKSDLNAAVMNKKVRQPELRPEVQKYIADTETAPVAGFTEPYKPAFRDFSQLTPDEKRALIAQLIT